MTPWLANLVRYVTTIIFTSLLIDDFFNFTQKKFAHLYRAVIAVITKHCCVAGLKATSEKLLSMMILQDVSAFLVTSAVLYVI